MKNLPWQRHGQGQLTVFEFYIPWKISAMANARDFKFCTRVGHAKSQSCDEWVFPKWAWSGSHEQFLHCGLRKFQLARFQLTRRTTRSLGDSWASCFREWSCSYVCPTNSARPLQANITTVFHRQQLTKRCHVPGGPMANPSWDGVAAAAATGITERDDGRDEPTSNAVKSHTQLIM